MKENEKAQAANDEVKKGYEIEEANQIIWKKLYQLKVENEQLKVENEQLKVENELYICYLTKKLIKILL